MPHHVERLVVLPARLRPGSIQLDAERVRHEVIGLAAVTVGIEPQLHSVVIDGEDLFAPNQVCPQRRRLRIEREINDMDCVVGVAEIGDRLHALGFAIVRPPLREAVHAHQRANRVGRGLHRDEGVEIRDRRELGDDQRGQRRLVCGLSGERGLDGQHREEDEDDQ